MIQARTDENGTFRIAGLPPGIYYIAAQQSEESTWIHQQFRMIRKLIYAQSYYPGVSQLGSATPIDLKAAQEVEANFSLTAESTYNIAGTVGDADQISSGKPSRGKQAKISILCRMSLHQMASSKQSFPLAHSPSVDMRRQVRRYRLAALRSLSVPILQMFQLR